MSGHFEPVRPVTDAEVESFWADGVVCLRGVLDLDVVERMAGAVEEALAGAETADMSALGDALAAAGEAVLVDAPPGSAPDAAGSGSRFRSGVDHWRSRTEFRRFASDGALTSAVATLMRSHRVQLYEDSVLAKEPGAVHRTAWHQDISYFNLDGEQLVTSWIPLDHVTRVSGALRFVRGSHLWGTVFRPNLFVSSMSIPGTEGDIVPDVEAAALAGDYEILSFDLGPGDLTVHHARTLHGAGANLSDRRRRAISIRYCGDDARFLRREGTVPKGYQRELRDGDELPRLQAPLVFDGGG